MVLDTPAPTCMGVTLLYMELMQREASTQQRLLALGRWKVRSD